uniref:NOT2_3_5 domain-containing protein n=1 Tax=Caenorhabditis tropicalis TaxID=1561998 RepID=A0A1I7UYG4_9PELO
MVRRGRRGTGPLSNNTSSSSGSHENQWKPLRAQSSSADTSLAKSAKSCDSANSSPGSGLSTSPSNGKKGSGKTARSSSNWRTRGGGSGQNMVIDSKFIITSEDFPALPGVRGEKGGNSQSTPSKNVKKEKDSGKHINTDCPTTDDSGVSSTSRGHSPAELTERTSNRESNSSSKADKKVLDEKKPVAAPLMAADHKRKNGSPVKERPPRGNVKSSRITVQQVIGNNSTPKKKTINANAATTAPSFMKLSKVGQKIPERRGGQRLNNHSPQSASSGSPTSDDKENTPKKEIPSGILISPELNVDIAEKPVNEDPKGTSVLSELFQQKTYETSEFPNAIPSSRSIFHPADVPKIELGKKGEMSNIPPTMLTDQFGLAAMLPILDIVKNRSVQVDTDSLTKEQLREKSENEHIEMIAIGFDLNELSVPMKTHDPSTKPVWETFAGPYGNLPLLPPSMGLSHNQVPSVYYTARTLQSSFDMLTNIPEKFGLHELFYIFYNLPKEIWQLNAARELQYRGWRYNIKERLWVLKMLPKHNESDNYNASISAPQNPFTQPGPNQEDLMVGNFEIYDAEKARICSAELSLRRSDFEIPAWEQKTPDSYQKMVASVFPKEMLWGPREDRKNFSMIQGISGVLPNFNGRNNKLNNLSIPTPQQSSEQRRLLSFIDSPDVSSNFENPFGTLPPTTAAQEIGRQQLYVMIMQKMQMHQQQQQQLHQQEQQEASSSQPRASSSFPGSNFPGN